MSAVDVSSVSNSPRRYREVLHKIQNIFKYSYFIFYCTLNLQQIYLYFPNVAHTVLNHIYRRKSRDLILKNGVLRLRIICSLIYMYLHWFYLSNENGLLDSDTLHTAQLLSPRFTSIWKLLYVHSSPLQTFHNAPVSDIQDLNRGPLCPVYRWLLPLVLYISLREYASTLMLPRDGVTWWDIHPVLLNLEVSIGGGKGRQGKR